MCSFDAQDLNVEWYMKVAEKPFMMLSCATIFIYDKKNRATTQTSLDCFTRGR